MADEQKTASVCITQQQLYSGVEKALMEAAPKPSMPVREKKGQPWCTYSNVKRQNASHSTAAVNCTGPRGDIVGNLSATFGQNNFDGVQTMDIKGPFGAMHVARTVSGHRQGDCQ